MNLLNILLGIVIVAFFGGAIYFIIDAYSSGDYFQGTVFLAVTGAAALRVLESISSNRR